MTLYLVDAETDQRVSEISNGGSITPGSDFSGSFSIEAVPAGPVGSVGLSIDGGPEQVENFVPYALFGDSDGDFAGEALGTGARSVTVTLYEGGNGGGSSSTFFVDFSVDEAAESPAPNTATEGDDILVGTDQGESIAGLGGDDTIEGGGGADDLYGGAGFDTATYANSATGINIGVYRTGSGGEAEGDTLDSIEAIIGTDHIDVLVGGGTNDVSLYGGAGADVIFDYRGNSALFGGEGDDIIVGHDGDDRIAGGRGIDLTIGGNGADTFVVDQLDFFRLYIADWEDGVDRIDASPVGLGFEDFTVVDTAQGIALDRMEGGALQRIHLFDPGSGPALDVSMLTAEDFI